MTLTELKAAVLRELGVLATGEDPHSADATVVADKYAALYELLVTENLVSWSSDDDVPANVASPITWMVAHMCASDFAVPPQRAAELALKGALNMRPQSMAERQLRRQLARAFVYSPIKTTFY
jgi:hypothetical protein